MKRPAEFHHDHRRFHHHPQDCDQGQGEPGALARVFPEMVKEGIPVAEMKIVHDGILASPWTRDASLQPLRRSWGP